MNAQDEGQQWHAGLTLHLSDRNPDLGKKEPLCGSRENPRAITGDITRVGCEKCLNALQQQVTELEGKAELADIFYQTLCELKKYRDKPDYLAHEMAQMLNSFEENYDALTSPSTIAQEEPR